MDHRLCLGPARDGWPRRVSGLGGHCRGRPQTRWKQLSHQPRRRSRVPGPHPPLSGRTGPACRCPEVEGWVLWLPWGPRGRAGCILGDRPSQGAEQAGDPPLSVPRVPRCVSRKDPCAMCLHEVCAGASSGPARGTRGSRRVGASMAQRLSGARITRELHRALWVTRARGPGASKVFILPEGAECQAPQSQSLAFPEPRGAGIGGGAAVCRRGWRQCCAKAGGGRVGRAPPPPLPQVHFCRFTPW